MSKAQTLATFRRHVKTWQRRMGLEGWDIKVEYSKYPEERHSASYAEIEYNHTNSSAIIWLSPTFWKNTERDPEDWVNYPTDSDKLEITAIHELGHLHEAPYKTFIWREIKDAFGTDSVVGDFMRQMFESYREQMIERPSRVMFNLSRAGV